MGRKNRLERRAKRKEKRADRKKERAEDKQKKAEELLEKGTKLSKLRANRLQKRAEQLTKRSEELEQKAQELKDKATVTKGCVATIYGSDDTGYYMTVKWNYEGGDQTPRYDHHRIDIRSSSPFSSKSVDSGNISASKFEWSTIIINMRYIVKVYGISGSAEQLIGRCIAKKLK